LYLTEGAADMPSPPCRDRRDEVADVAREP
jgi:hypothetical protein